MRVFHLLKRIARKHEVVLGCHAWCREEMESAGQLTQFGVRAVTGLLDGGIGGALARVTNLLNRVLAVLRLGT